MFKELSRHYRQCCGSVTFGTDPDKGLDVVKKFDDEFFINTFNKKCIILLHVLSKVVKPLNYSKKVDLNSFYRKEC
jgi:hypothetical protein